MTNEEIKRLMEFIVTQQAEITVKQAQMIDIQFETAKRQNEFEIKFNNKLDALVEWQAKFSTDLDAMKEETKEINNTLKDASNTLKQVSSLAIETSARVDKLEGKQDK